MNFWWMNDMVIWVFFWMLEFLTDDRYDYLSWLLFILKNFDFLDFYFYILINKKTTVIGCRFIFKHYLLEGLLQEKTTI